MTPKQRITLNADWWPAACRAQGWKSSDRDLRLRVCAWAVSLESPSQLDLLNAIRSDDQPRRWLESTNDLDNGEDIDRVKACLLMLADDVVNADRVEARARRLRAVIRRYLADLRGFGGDPDALLAKLIRDKFGSGYDLDELTADPIITTDHRTGLPRETASRLDQVMFTLARILSTKRKETNPF